MSADSLSEQQLAVMFLLNMCCSKMIIQPIAGADMHHPQVSYMVAQKSMSAVQNK
jgi:hypothetical protein